MIFAYCHGLTLWSLSMETIYIYSICQTKYPSHTSPKRFWPCSLNFGYASVTQTISNPLEISEESYPIHRLNSFPPLGSLRWLLLVFLLLDEASPLGAGSWSNPDALVVALPNICTLASSSLSAHYPSLYPLFSGSEVSFPLFLCSHFSDQLLRLIVSIFYRRLFVWIICLGKIHPQTLKSHTMIVKWNNSFRLCGIIEFYLVLKYMGD